MHTKAALVLAVVAMGLVGSSVYVWQHKGSDSAMALIEATSSPSALVSPNPTATTASATPTQPSSPTWIVTGTSLTEQAGWPHPGL